MCVCAATFWFGWRMLQLRNAPQSVCLAVVLAGLMGNAIGQAQGAVVDFIAVGPIADDSWLVGNVADLALVGGMFSMGFVLIWEWVGGAG